MKPFDKCPVGGNELVEKDVEKLLRGGNHSALVVVRAEVCLHCGERLFSEEQIRLFEQTRTKLAQDDTAEFDYKGKFYHVPIS